MEFDEAPSPKFSHSPLPSPSHIRLFSLNPRRNLSDRLSGSFSIHPVTDTPQYNALSYAPGDASVREEVWVDASSTISVPRNLHRALRDLPTDRIFTLWVDALCINKGDTVERNAQVLLIRNVFSQAHNVLVWLGDKVPVGGCAVPPSGKVSTSMRKLSNRSARRDAQIKEMIAKHPNTYDRLLTVKEHEVRSFREAKETMGDVLQHPSMYSDWPTQVWSLPQLALSKSCIAYWSGESLYWGELAWALSNIIGLSTVIQPGVFRFMRLEQMRARMDVHEPQASDGSSSSTTTTTTTTAKPKSPLVYHAVEWPHALSYVSGMNSTLLRDKIYAAINLLLPKEAALYPPDYSEDTRSLLIRLATEMLKQYGPGFLAHVDHNQEVSKALGHAEGLDDMPSWVPDYVDRSSASHNTRRFWQSQLQDMRRPIKPPMSPDDIQEQQQQQQRRIVPENTMVSFSGPPQHPNLEVYGHIDETVAITGANNEWREMRKQGNDTTLSFLRTLKKWISMLEQIGPGLHLEALEALLGSGPDAAKASRKNQWESLRDHVVSCGGWHSMQHAAARTSLARLRDEIQEELDWNYGDSGELIMGSESARAALADWQEITRERRLMITEGGYVGFAPADTRPGDALVLFDESEMRFVMRREGERWRMIGGCFLQRKPLPKRTEGKNLKTSSGQKFVIC